MDRAQATEWANRFDNAEVESLADGTYVVTVEFAYSIKRLSTTAQAEKLWGECFPPSVIRYTTAPEAYDGGGTKTLDPNAGTDNRGGVIRKISIVESNLNWQVARNSSGLHATVEDPTMMGTLWTMNPVKS